MVGGSNLFIVANMIKEVSLFQIQLCIINKHKESNTQIIHVLYMCDKHVLYMYCTCTVHVQYMYSTCIVHVLIVQVR